MMSFPGDFSPEDRSCDSRKGGTQGGGWGHPKGENIWRQPSLGQPVEHTC